ncbi:MAG TPA: archaetidylinositol phosphate synthase [Candidatus Nanoarchaeia archaeon]|nr:archaetidylinositol phosphate synthase [Candidatus Nanoarchaeia archaeon]
MLTKLKQKVQQLLSTEAAAAHKIGLTPNGVTVFGFILSFFAASAYALVTTYSRPYLLFIAVILLMASGFCDTLDGILARTYNQASAFGGFLDSLLDRYADAFMFAGIIVSGACNLFVGLAALASSLMVSYSRARAEAAGIKMESIGIAERPERILILAASSLAAILWFPALNIGVLIVALLATITVIQRGLHVYKSL